MGPVNMVAIRRGLLARWTRTLWVGMGCVALESAYIALGFWGGTQLMERLPAEGLRRWVGLPGAVVILIIGVHILRKAIRNPQRVVAARDAESGPAGRPSRLRDLLTGAVLTLINPGVLLYWLGAGSKVIQQADVRPGSPAMWYGVLAATGGLTLWFACLSVLVRRRPQKVGPGFFRAVNAVSGGLLTIVGVVLAVAALL